MSKLPPHPLVVKLTPTYRWDRSSARQTIPTVKEMVAGCVSFRRAKSYKNVVSSLNLKMKTIIIKQSELGKKEGGER